MYLLLYNERRERYKKNYRFWTGVIFLSKNTSSILFNDYRDFGATVSAYLSTVKPAAGPASYVRRDFGYTR